MTIRQILGVVDAISMETYNRHVELGLMLTFTGACYFANRVLKIASTGSTINCKSGCLLLADGAETSRHAADFLVSIVEQRHSMDNFDDLIGSELKIKVCLGWEMRVSHDQGAGSNFDLDVTCFMLNKNGKVNDWRDMICYANPTSRCGSVVHLGDNKVGSDKRDEKIDVETIAIDLKKIPERIAKLLFVATIHKCVERKQTFKMVRNAFIRILEVSEDGNEDEEVARFDLTSEAKAKTAIIFCALNRQAEGWEHEDISEGRNCELWNLAQELGVVVKSKTSVQSQE